MKFGEKIVEGVFLERPNRYLARIEIAGQETLAHVPDPGRLPGLLLTNRKVMLVHQPSEKRKTDYTLVLVRHGSIWVSTFPAFANSLVANALMEQSLSFLKGYSNFASEVKAGNSRFDFRLDFPKNSAYVEVRSVSLVEDSIGRFPDAPTKRGIKHVKELIEFCVKGHPTAVFFVSQRSDTKSITCNDNIDPEFGKYLRLAKKEGVELYGMNCKVTPTSISLNESVEVIL